MARRKRAAPRPDSGKFCKDCKEEGVARRRPTPFPGPRCATHHRTRRKAVSARAHDARVEKVYGITAEQYDALYQAQGGFCYCGCGATGAAKRLAVDHDHATGYVRGLLCKRANRDVLGHFRDDPERLRRMADYLENPPAFAVIGRVRAPVEKEEE